MIKKGPRLLEPQPAKAWTWIKQPRTSTPPVVHHANTDLICRCAQGATATAWKLSDQASAAVWPTCPAIPDGGTLDVGAPLGDDVAHLGPASNNNGAVEDSVVK